MERMRIRGQGHYHHTGQALVNIERVPFEKPLYAEAFKEAFEKELDSMWEAHPGDVFGEICLFPQICRYRYENAKAVSEVQVFILSLDAFKEVADFSPEFAHKLQEHAEILSGVLGVTNEVFQKQASKSHSKGHTTKNSKFEEEVQDWKAELMLVYERGLSSSTSGSAKSPLSQGSHNQSAMSLSRASSMLPFGKALPNIFRCVRLNIPCQCIQTVSFHRHSCSNFIDILCQLEIPALFAMTAFFMQGLAA
jgi:CRP-like cAMP-binding protein